MKKEIENNCGNLVYGLEVSIYTIILFLVIIYFIPHLLASSMLEPCKLNNH